MSLFSDQTLRTMYYDPTSHDANIVEFSLDNGTGYTSNMRIIGLGTHRASGTDHYNDAVGVLGKIRAIHLTSNGQKLDSLRNANRYFAFQNVLKSNQQQNSLVSKDNKSARGLIVYSSKQEIDARARVQCATAAATLAVREATYGSLNLVDCFPVLSQMMHLDTSVFTNVKIRIEYETDPSFLVSAALTTANNSDPVPVLVAEQFQNLDDVAKMTKAMGPVMWDTIEHDQIRIDEIAQPGTNASTTVETSKKLLAFNDKYVSKMIVLKQNAVKSRDTPANGLTTHGYGTYASQAQFQEKFNCRLNGKNMFVGSGLDTPAKMTASTVDAWGSYVLAPGDDTTSLGVNSQTTNVVVARAKGARPLQANKLNDKVGQSSYIGYHIEDKVKDLQIDYSRTGVSDTDARLRYNTALNLHFFGQVRKSLVVKGNKFMISYM